MNVDAGCDVKGVSRGPNWCKSTPHHHHAPKLNKVFVFLQNFGDLCGAGRATVITVEANIK